MAIKTSRMLCLLAAAALAATACVSVAAADKKAAPAGGKAPGWMSELDNDYPNAKFLAAVGSGDTRRDAEADAMGALARQFTVKVKVDADAQQRYAELTKGDKTYTESERKITQNVGTQASEQFVNLRFSDPYVEKSGRTNIVAFIERQPTADIYRKLIRKDLDKSADFAQRGAAAAGALQAFSLYDASYQVALNAERLLAQLRIIHGPSASMLEGDLDVKKTAEARDAAAAKLSYKMTIEGDADGKISGILKTLLADQSLSAKADGTLTVKGSWLTEPVAVNPSFKSVRWTINVSLLDEQGTAIATVFKESRENGIGESEARALAYREVEKRLKKDFPQAIQDYLTRSATKN